MFDPSLLLDRGIYMWSGPCILCTALYSIIYHKQQATLATQWLLSRYLVQKKPANRPSLQDRICARSCGYQNQPDSSADTYAQKYRT